MAKKLLIVLVFSLLASGTLFADYDKDTSDENDNSFPRNTITIDVLSTGISLLTTAFINDTFAIKDFLILTALQYEFQFTNKFSAAARLGVKYVNFDDELFSFSAEGHVKFYPAGRTFYLGGLLGYANFSYTGMPNYNFLILGARVGWRIDFGRKGGFILEPSLGYTAALGDPKFGQDFSDSEFDSVYSFLIRQYLIGGFQFSLSMGYRF